MQEGSTLGERLTSVRKRRGLTQRELAKASGLSYSLVKKVEQDDYGELRLETAHKLATALRVPTAAIMPRDEAHDDVQPDIAETWEPVRRALAGERDEVGPGEEPTLVSVRQAFDEA
ncbi:MAG TPA: helix-turn-helix transcriptional regulator, partial [Streptosporangiaceae bacterium]